ncbi:hypothetical protein [Actinocorallia longicatena]|uniref:Uncharacterized protein n=1 Tax=Actinocorallia longicatena TaxID=111803 RepID=A0ABP6QFJ5_9ACTN
MPITLPPHTGSGGLIAAADRETPTTLLKLIREEHRPTWHD